MGTWGPDIDDDDVFVDVYQDYFDAYNNGAAPEELIDSVREEFGECFEDEDDYSAALFALALASWETKSLTDRLFDEVKSRIEGRGDLENFEGRDASTDSIGAREKHLAEFLKKLSKPRGSKKRRVKAKDEHSVVVLIDLDAPDNRKKLLVERISINNEYYCTTAHITWVSGVGGGLFGFSEDNVSIDARWVDSNHLNIAIIGKCHSQQLVDRNQAFRDVVEITYEAPDVTTTL